MAQQAEFEVVEEIGDQSYQSFLQSKAWKEICIRVIERARACAKPAAFGPRSWSTI
jgi:hypothetical protein